MLPDMSPQIVKICEMDIFGQNSIEVVLNSYPVGTIFAIIM